jgi:hypothetical protein
VRRLDAALESRFWDHHQEKGGVKPPHSKALRAGSCIKGRRFRADSETIELLLRRESKTQEEH